MSDAPENADPTTSAEATEQTQGDPVDAPLGEGGKKALDAERAARKEAERLTAELKQRLDALESANLSDLEKVQKQNKELQEAASRASAEAAQLRLATKYGLTEEEAADLPDDPEKAERLAARLADRKSDSLKPKPDPTQGGMGGTGSKNKGDAFADFANSFFTR